MELGLDCVLSGTVGGVGEQHKLPLEDAAQVPHKHLLTGAPSPELEGESPPPSPGKWWRALL